MRAVIAVVALLGFVALAAGQGAITIGQLPAAPIASVSWPTAAPIFSDWIPIYTTWADTSRLPSTVTVTIDFTTASSGALVFISSQNPTGSGSPSVTLTLSGTALLNSNTPAGYFAFALVNADPSSSTPPAPTIRIQASPQPDWPATVGTFLVAAVTRPIKLSISGNGNTGFAPIAPTPPPAAVSLVPGVLSQPITIEFVMPPQQPMGPVSIQIDTTTPNCGVSSTGTAISCGNFYNFLPWAPDSDTPPAASALNTVATWSNVPTGTRKLTFQIATHPSLLTNFPPFVQTLVFQNQGGRYANIAYFPSTNGSNPASYILPNLQLTLSGGDAGQYNPTGTNPRFLFNPVANINQVPVFLDSVSAPSMLTGTTASFTYRLAHPLAGQSVTYNLQAPPGVTVNPTSISFNCASLTGGAAACPTTQTVSVTIDPNFVFDGYALVEIYALQPAGTFNFAFPRSIPSIQINIVDRFTDNEMIFDSLPAAVAVGQSFTFSVRTRIAPAPGVTLNVRFISQEFAFDASTYSLSAGNTGFMVTATALSSPLFKAITYPGAQAPATPYSTGGDVVSVIGFITAIFSGQTARNYIKNGIWDAANSNFAVVVGAGGGGENFPAGGIEIFRYQFQYQQATLLNGGANYVINTWDQPTAQITVGLKNAPPAGGVSLTPIINCAYVTANPPTLTFSPGNNEASFTLTANRDGAVATAGNLFGTNPCTINFAMSGESTFNYIQPPSFTVSVPTAPYAFTATIEGGLTNTNGNPRTFAIGVTPNYLPRAGNTVTLQPFWALGTFTPASQTWTSAETAFTKTFLVTESDFIDSSLFIGTSSAKLAQISWSITGADAGYYTVNNLAGPAHATRTINLPAAPASFTVGSVAMVKVFLSDAPTAGTVIVTPVLAVPGALTFSPASYTFTAGSPTTALFQVTGNNIGSWYVAWEITGTDQYLYNSGAAGSQFTTFVVGARGGVTVPIAPPPAGFVSGFWYGPFDARVSGYTTSPLTAGSLNLKPTSDDWKFQPATLSFSANGVSTPFLMRYMPSTPLKPAADSTSSFDFSTVIEFNLGGTDAWQYAIPAKQTPTVRHRTIVFSDETGASPPALSGPAGVPVLMWVTLPDGPVPTSGITVTVSSDNLLFAQALGAPVGNNTGGGAPSLDITFAGDVVRQQVLVWTNFNGAWGQARQAFTDSLNAKFSIYTTVAGADAAHYANPPDLLQTFTLVKKLFYFDTNALAAVWENVLNSDAPVPQIPVGQVSQKITVGTTGLVGSTVTLTPVCGYIPGEPFSSAGYTGCPYITFTPSELVFNAGQQTASFTFTPIALAPRGAPVIISWSVTGSEASAWDIQIGGVNSPGNNVPNELNVQPVPSLSFSPMPAIYIDGKAEDLVVTLNAPTDFFPPFQLQVRPSVAGVVVEPDIMEFAPGASPRQTFSIRHVRPAAISPGGHTYTLTWALKFAGAFTTVTLFPRIIPVDVTEVRIVRYAIIPEFPTVLGLDWLTARINLTRAPFGDVSLVPHLPNFGPGQINVGSNPNSAAYYPNQNQVGVKVPGGRVIFDPPAVTFQAGQIVSQFKVRADRLSDNEALYLRVDWEPVFHAEDVNCYYPFAYTWHIAAASTATLAWALVAALAALLLL